MDSEFVKKRLEKDLQELKKMIEKHFEQRKSDEADISGLEGRIEKRKEARAKQIAERAKVRNLENFPIFGKVGKRGKNEETLFRRSKSAWPGKRKKRKRENKLWKRNALPRRRRRRLPWLRSMPLLARDQVRFGKD